MILDPGDSVGRAVSGMERIASADRWKEGFVGNT